jgi:hypothetical protein
MPSHQLHTHARTSRIARKHHAEVQEFLNRIARAITAGDGATVAKMWELPGFVFGVEMAKVINDRDELARFFGGAKAQYNAQGITDTRPDIVDEEWIGDRMVIVKVRWPYLDADDREVGAEASDYTLWRDDRGALKIRSILMRGVEGTGGTKPS